MNFFRNFPKTTMRVENVDVKLIDISIRTKIMDWITKNDEYLIKEKYSLDSEQRPEQASMELYDTTDYTYILLVLNNVYDIYEDWICPSELLDRLIIKKHGSIQNAMRKVYQWYDQYGTEVSPKSPKKYRSLSYYDKLMQDNENKRVIKTLDLASTIRIHNDFAQVLSKA